MNYGPSFPYINNSSISNTTSSINISENPNNPQPSLNEAITKAIAANPNFQSVLAAAISSYVGNKTTTTTTSNNNSEQRKPSPTLCNSQTEANGRSLSLFPTLASNSTSHGGVDKKDHSS